VRQDCRPIGRKNIYIYLRYSTTYEDFIGSIIQLCEMAYFIRTVREQNIIKICSLLNRQISLCVFSFCAKWVKSCPNPVNISTAWKNLRSFLSIRLQEQIKCESGCETLYACGPIGCVCRCLWPLDSGSAGSGWPPAKAGPKGRSILFFAKLHEVNWQHVRHGSRNHYKIY